MLLYRLWIIFLLVVGICGVSYVRANYDATQGSGTTFGSNDVGGVKFPKMVITDPTTVSQMAGVDASGNLKVIGTGVAQASATSGQTLSPVGCAATTAARAISNGNTDILNCDTSGQLRVVQSADPCLAGAKTTAAFSQTSVANIITASASNKNYICSILINANGGAEIFNVVEDDTSGCGSPTAALVGSTTAANGVSVAQLSGWSASGGGGTLLAGLATNRYTCITQSGSNRISGYITYVQAP